MMFASVQSAPVDDLPLPIELNIFFYVANISSSTCFRQCFVVSGPLNTAGKGNSDTIENEPIGIKLTNQTDR